jgi:quercetin dioxygenase-like cupin family protein
VDSNNLPQAKEAEMRRVLLLMFFVVAAQTAFAQDPVAVDGKHYKVLFENDQVRVLQIHYGVKEKSVMHEHPATVVVFMSSSRVKFTLPDGSTVADAGGKAGEVRYAEAGKHLPENIGRTEVNAVLVELKGRPPMGAAVQMDPVKIDPVHHKVVIDNERVRVLRINLPPHVKIKQHEHPNAVAIFMTNVKSKFTLGDGTTREGAGKRGEAIWAAAEKHSVENMGARPARVILVELK